MKHNLRAAVAASVVLATIPSGGTVFAQKPGGILVWEIERRLAEDAARPIIFYPRSGACWQPQFKGHTMVINGNYNNWRLEDAWLDN
jgi:hypothetical protein